MNLKPLTNRIYKLWKNKIYCRQNIKVFLNKFKILTLIIIEEMVYAQLYERDIKKKAK